MKRYADPAVCPDCGAAIPPDPDRCPACALPLRNPTAVELFGTLQHADVLLARLRATPANPPAAVPVPSAATSTTTATVPAYPASTPPPARRPSSSGVRGSSVPGILLALGGLCLLVAAVIFLAVAWSWLGVGGRTAVLVVLTLASAGAGLWWARRGLRIAAEALTTVALGLLALDLLGAEDAGWLGSASPSALVATIGAAVALAGLGLALAGRHESTTLVAPQVVATLGVLLAYGGLHGAVDADLWISGLSVGVLVGLGWLAHRSRTGLKPLAWSLAGVSVVVWLDLVASGLIAVADDVSLTGLWSGPGWALAAATAYLAGPALIPALRATAAGWLGAAGVLGSLTLALPVLDEVADAVALVAVIILAVWTVLAWALPRPWAWAARVPALAAALPSVVVLLALVGQSAARLVTVGPAYSSTIGVELPEADPVLSPWLLAPAALALTALVLELARSWSAGRVLVVAPLAVGALSAVATLGLFAVPVWTVVLATLLLAAALTGLALNRERVGLPLTLGAGLLLAAAATVALPSAGLVGLVGVVLTGAALTTVALARFPGGDVVGFLAAPLGVAMTVHAFGEVFDLSQTYRALLVLLLLGGAASWRPRPELEASSSLCGVAVSGAAVVAVDGGAGALALLLTVAGALVTISALLNADRRFLGWVGGALLAAATWVRLADLGVGVPEAYTLPSALALMIVGGWRLRQDPSASTARALGAGLALATLPSLLWTLDDPVSWRALLLGAACLVLLLGGVTLRWNALVVVGAAVGTVLVLVELAPYVVETPQWVLIGLAGATLTAVGVTWESRMRDVRHAGAYLERLR